VKGQGPEATLERFSTYSSLHVQVGYACQNDCLFCCDGGRAAQPEPMQPDTVREILARNRRLEVVVFTRREPTLNPRLVDYVALARELGYRGIIVITNGRALARGDLAARLVAAGVTRIGISFHGPDAALHDAITGCRGSFEQVVQGIRAVAELRAAGRPVELKLHSTVCALNAERLPEMVELALGFTPDSYGLNAMFLSGMASVNAERLALPYPRMVECFRRCLRPGRHLPISLSEVPHCAVLGQVPFEYLGFREDFHLVDLGDGGAAPRTRARSAPRGFRHRPGCRQCALRAHCDGIPAAYLERYGWRGLEPIRDLDRLAFVPRAELEELLRAPQGAWQVDALQHGLDAARVSLRATRPPTASIELQISARDDLRPAFARTARFNLGLTGSQASAAEIELAHRVADHLGGGVEARGDGLDMLILAPPDFIYRPGDRGIPTYPEEEHLPYGALALASYLRRAGLRVMVAPLQAFYQQEGRFHHFDDGGEPCRRSFATETDRILQALVRRLQPRSFGLSINYAIHERAAEIILELLRRSWPERPVLAGGNHATHTAARWLGLPWPVDGVALGEGERSCLEWLRRGPRGDAIPGLARRAEDGGIRVGREVEPLRGEELDTPVDVGLAALPRWAPASRFSPLCATSRGCLHRCNFCASGSMWGCRRPRPLGAIAAEVGALVAGGARRVLLAEDMLDPRGGQLEALGGVLGRFTACRFTAPLRQPSLERCPPELLLRAGIDHVLVGLESFSPRVLRAMGKNLSATHLARVEVTFERLRRAGVGVTLFMLIGHPGSSIRLDSLSVRRCRQLAERGLLAGLSAVHVAPFPGTALATWAARGERLRVIEPRTNRWTLDQPLVELVDEGGRVSYSAEQMREVFGAFREIGEQLEARQQG